MAIFENGLTILTVALVMLCIFKTGNISEFSSVDSQDKGEHFPHHYRQRRNVLPSLVKYEVNVELYVKDVGTVDYLRSLLSNGSFSLNLSSTANVTNILITTVCSPNSSGYQCRCEDQYRWPCDQCLTNGPCDTITNNTCGCINTINPDGQSCQSVALYNFTACSTTTSPPPTSSMYEYIISVEMNVSDVTVINLLRTILSNISYPIEISNQTQIYKVNITTVCSPSSSGFQCICEDQYRWSCDQCQTLGSCDNITDNTCGCINRIPPDGQYCQSVYQHNFTACPVTTMSPITSTSPTMSPAPTSPGVLYEYIISIAVNVSDVTVINLLRTILSNISYPIEISNQTQIYEVNITTVCSPSSSGFQCICEDQYRWSCDQCQTLGSCDNITDNTCGCINRIPPDGQYCQSVYQHNFTACPVTTMSPITSTSPTMSPAPTSPGVLYEYIISIAVNVSDVTVINLLRTILSNISYPIEISNQTQIYEVNITTVCSPSSSGFQCICEDQYRWSCDQCQTLGSCDNITDNTCGCINRIPPDGQYCQSVYQHNFTACPVTTMSPITSTSPTMSPAPTSPGVLYEYIISIAVNVSDVTVINLLRTILSNISYPIEISNQTQIYEVNITTVCSPNGTAYQCRCEEQFSWPCGMCSTYGTCDDLRNNTCGCINALPPDGVYCQQVTDPFCPTPTPPNATITPTPTAMTDTANNTTNLNTTTPTTTAITFMTNLTTATDVNTTTAETPTNVMENTIIPSVMTTTANTTMTSMANTTDFTTTVPTEATTPVNTTVLTTANTTANTTVPTEATTPVNTTVLTTANTTANTTVPTEATTPVNPTVLTTANTTANTTVPTEATTPVNTTVLTTANTTANTTVPTAATTPVNTTVLTTANTTANTTVPTEATTPVNTTVLTTANTTANTTVSTTATTPVNTTVLTSSSTTANTTVSTAATTPVNTTVLTTANTTANTTVSTTATTPMNTTASITTTTMAITTVPTTSTTIVNTTTTTSTTTTTAATTMTTTTATSTTIATTTPTALSVEMSITLNYTYTASLSNSSSPAYRDLASRIVSVLENQYKEITGFIAVSVTGFRQGSVITDYVVQTTEVNAGEIANANQNLPKAMTPIAPVIGPVSAVYNSPISVRSPDLTYTGNSMTLTCGPSTEGVNIGQISDAIWTFQGLPIIAGGRMTITTVNSISNLTVNNVILADSGTYQCTLMGAVVSFIQVGTVRGDQITQAPILQLQSQVNYKCTLGLLPLQCCVQFPYTVNWYQGTTILKSGSSSNSGSYCITYNYQIQNCVTAQQTSFTCKVDNPQGYQMTETVNIFIDAVQCTGDPYGNGRVGDTSVIACVQGQEGSKTAVCQAPNTWKVMSDTCIVTKIKELLIASQSLAVEQVPAFVADLSQAVQQNQTEITNSTASISAIVGILNTIANVPTPVNETTMQDVLNAVNVIVGNDARQSWVILNANQTSNASSTLLGSLETISNGLIGEFTLTTPLILLKRTMFHNSFSADLNNSITVDITNTGISNTYITTITFSTLNNVMPARNSTSQLNATSNQTVDDNAINADVVLVKLNATIHNVTLSYVKLNNSLTLNPQCVFWNFHLFNNLGAWDNGGCNFVSDINDRVTCSCNHLTSFSILMATDIPASLSETLDIITYIGVGISLASLVICLIIEGYVWKAITRNSTAFMRHVAIVNTALSLLIADICFIIGASIAKNPLQNPGEDYDVPVGPCSTATFFMHFFYLALFFWMLVSGLLLFYRTVMVFSHMSKSAMLAIGFSLGYGCPLIIAVITVAVTAPGHGYIRKDYACWLNWTETKALLALVIPALTIVFINILIIIVVLFKMLRRGMRDTAQTDEKHTLVVIARCVAILTPLFGLTWSLGVGTMVSPTNKGIHIAFAFFNSLQGFFILVFGTLFDSKIRSLLIRRSPTTSTGSGSVRTRSTSGGLSPLRQTNLLHRLRGRRYVYHVSRAANTSSSAGVSESYVSFE